MVLLINGKLLYIGWHFKYYFFFDNLFQTTSGLENSLGCVFWLKKFKNDIEIALKPTGFEL